MAQRLVDAISPYLRSHAENPVDWYPWGEAAFREARDRDVPVLISIGYSTCHWCHVMARESFSDPGIADELNSRFVSIKVDREEHPEVDSVYMAAAGAFTQNLGWPLNVFVAPNGRPFFAGTYFPPTPVQGVPSFRQVLDAVTDAWQNNREGVSDTSGRLAEGLRAAALSTASHPLPSDAEFEELVAVVAAREDTAHGGFGTAPKFPMAPVLRFLLSRSAHDAVARDLAFRTLASMAVSGLRDPIEGGFFRYATREDWTEPHYERMLYDNAQLLDLYSRAAVLDTPGERASLFAATAEGVAQFLLTVMRLPDGGFASAQDSESVVDGRRVEGFYYTLDAPSRARVAAPALDRKVLTGWNGWAIEALARAGFALDRPEWMAAAAREADFLLREHVTADGQLIRASLSGRSSTAPATAEDYGGFAGALLTLGALTGSLRYVSAGRDLVDRALSDRRAGDPVLADHGLSWTDDPSEGAYPSGVSALAHACVIAHQLTGVGHYRENAERLLGRAGDMTQQPFAFGAALSEVTALLHETELVLVDVDDDVTGEARRFSGLISVADRQAVQDLAAAGFSLFDGRAESAAYYCVGGVCRLPLHSGAELRAELGG